MAKIGEILGLGGNPLYQAFAGNRNAFSGAFSGMASNPSNPWGGFAEGARVGGLADQRLAKEQDQQNATQEWLSANYPQYAGLPAAQGWEAAMKDISNAQSGKDLMNVGGNLYNRATGEWITPPSDAANRQSVSLQGQWGTDAQGNPVYLQPSSTGEFVQAQAPEGVSLLGPYDLNANRAAGSAYGKSVAGAQFDLPGAELIGNQTVAAINDVRGMKQGMAEHFGNVMGVPQQMTPAWPGSEKAKFQVAADRVINRAFLEGREMLKGAGSITDFESRKAEAAITAAQGALEKGDQAQFLKALDDFEQAVRDGVAKLQRQAGTIQQYGGQQQVAPAGQTAGGLSWSIEQ